MIDIKFLFAVLASIIGVGGVIPYVRDILRDKTKPHAYSWLIWSITQGTALFGILHGDGGVWAAATMGIAVVSNIVIFVLSLRHGTRNITTSDTIIFLIAMAAIVVWWQLHQPIIALLMVMAIDFAGYLPSFRKTFAEPWTETVFSWVTFSAAAALTILALESYNFMTTAYILMTFVANIILLTICLVRRRVVPKSNPAI